MYNNDYKAFGAWYNPTTWFSSKAKEIEVKSEAEKRALFSSNYVLIRSQIPSIINAKMTLDDLFRKYQNIYYLQNISSDTKNRAIEGMKRVSELTEKWENVYGLIEKYNKEWESNKHSISSISAVTEVAINGLNLLKDIDQESKLLSSITISKLSSSDKRKVDTAVPNVSQKIETALISGNLLSMKNILIVGTLGLGFVIYKLWPKRGI